MRTPVADFEQAARRSLDDLAAFCRLAEVSGFDSLLTALSDPGDNWLGLDLAPVEGRLAVGAKGLDREAAVTLKQELLHDMAGPRIGVGPHSQRRRQIATVRQRGDRGRQVFTSLRPRQLSVCCSARL